MENNIHTIPESKEHWLRLRHQNVNSTEVSCLFGCNPYMTEFELWHYKRSGDIPSIEETEVMRWGTRLQDVIANGIADDNGWKSIRPMKEYIYNEELRIGSSFDYLIDGEIILEIKNVSERVYGKQWSDEEAPPHIELQVQTQMLISRKSKAKICALVGGNSAKIIDRDFMPSVGEAILKKVKHFWTRQDEPKVDFERDAEFVKSLYQKINPGKILEGNNQLLNLARQYNKLGSDKSRAEQMQKAIQAQILMLVGDAEQVVHPEFKMSLGQVKESIVERHVRAARRNFRLTMKGNEENV